MPGADERKKYIMETALRSGTVSIPDTALHFDVSVETIRRDVNALCEENRLRKIHGGAVPVKLPMRRDSDYMSRISTNQQAKISIGTYAAKTIRSGEVVMFDCGVSVQSVAAAVHELKNVIFITNSVPTASILLEKHAADEFTGRIIFIGGEMNCENRFAAGSHAYAELSQYRADRAFISCTALSFDGASTYNTDESRYSAQLMRCSSTSVLIAESVKFGKNSVCLFAQLSDFSSIITDAENKIPESIVEAVSNAGVSLEIV